MKNELSVCLELLQWLVVAGLSTEDLVPWRGHELQFLALMREGPSGVTDVGDTEQAVIETVAHEDLLPPVVIVGDETSDWDSSSTMFTNKYRRGNTLEIVV